MYSAHSSRKMQRPGFTQATQVKTRVTAQPVRMVFVSVSFWLRKGLFCLLNCLVQRESKVHVKLNGLNEPDDSSGPVLYPVFYSKKRLGAHYPPPPNSRLSPAQLDEKLVHDHRVTRAFFGFALPFTFFPFIHSGTETQKKTTWKIQGRSNR